MVGEAHEEGTRDGAAGHPLLAVFHGGVVPNLHGVCYDELLQRQHQLENPGSTEDVVDEVQHPILVRRKGPGDAVRDVAEAAHVICFYFASGQDQREAPQCQDQHDATDRRVDGRQQHQRGHVVEDPDGGLDGHHHEVDGLPLATPEDRHPNARQDRHNRNDDVPVAVAGGRHLRQTHLMARDVHDQFADLFVKGAVDEVEPSGYGPSHRQKQQHVDHRSSQQVHEEHVDVAQDHREGACDDEGPAGLDHLRQAVHHLVGGALEGGVDVLQDKVLLGEAEAPRKGEGCDILHQARDVGGIHPEGAIETLRLLLLHLHLLQAGVEGIAVRRAGRHANRVEQVDVLAGRQDLVG
mmetsp:Transcript_93624/g.222599  ORF Transcript_93624/g.222599 Transcript_93624/m.222599 type:complete len:352 (+) Transcript_93624:647-1702(+)